MSKIRTSSQAIDALGGTAAVASLTGERMNTVSMWRRPDRGLPGRVHYRVSRELEARGLPFDPDALFGPPLTVNDEKPESAAGVQGGSPGLVT